jgi:thioredoxin-dependent peroxiredoxin
MLKEGDKAPTFTLPSDEEKELSLKDFAGKPVVIYFYPKDMTPGCTQQACDFRDSFSQFKKKKVTVLGISRDAVTKHQTFKEKYTLPFILLSDEKGKVCQEYGVWKEKSLYGRKFMGIERTTFIVGANGKILKIYPKVKVKGHVEEVLNEF